MKLKFKLLLILSISLLSAIKLNAQNQRRWEDIDTTGYYKKEQISKDGFTLIFINKDPNLNAATANSLKDAFWKVYPKMVKHFNKKAMHTITMMIGTEYRGVAATLNGVVKIDQEWIRKNPKDIDLLTHELMHVVQTYGYNVPDNWLTDGIADYGRYAFGINNAASGWSLTPFQQSHSYKNSYRIAARFLVWVEQHKDKSIVKALDKALREGKYQPITWERLTGKSLDALWQEYAANPSIKERA